MTSFWAQTTSVEARLQRSLSAIPDQQAGCSRSADNRAWITKTASTMLIGPRVRGARTSTAHARITAGYTTHAATIQVLTKQLTLRRARRISTNLGKTPLMADLNMLKVRLR